MTATHKSSLTDRVYKLITALLGSGAFLFIFLIAAVLVIFSYPSIGYNGLTFFTSSVWNPGLNNPNALPTYVRGFFVMPGASFGMVVYFAGTILTSSLALIIGVPVSLGVAVFLSQIAPARISSPFSFLVGLLAGIPSIIYGLWGLLVLIPFLYRYVAPVTSRYLGFIPGLGGPISPSEGFLASGLILSLMIVPIVASISRDAMAQTPIELKEGAKALGMTNSEITWKIVLPYAKTGIIGSVILGLGRALGETMAVAMVSGGASTIPHSLYDPVNTIAAFIAINLDGAFEDPSRMFVYALVELALVLLATTTLVNVMARLLVRRGFFSTAEKNIQVGI